MWIFEPVWMNKVIDFHQESDYLVRVVWWSLIHLMILSQFAWSFFQVTQRLVPSPHSLYTVLQKCCLQHYWQWYWGQSHWMPTVGKKWCSKKHLLAAKASVHWHEMAKKKYSHWSNLRERGLNCDWGRGMKSGERTSVDSSKFLSVVLEQKKEKVLAPVRYLA